MNRRGCLKAWIQGAIGWLLNCTAMSTCRDHVNRVAAYLEDSNEICLGVSC